MARVNCKMEEIEIEEEEDTTILEKIEEYLMRQKVERNEGHRTSFETTPFFGPIESKIIITEEQELEGIPEDLRDSSLSKQEVIIDFKREMKEPQRRLAVEHAARVKEGKESVLMNEMIRKKYCEGTRYYFPDRSFNSALQLKDFRCLFIINVDEIKQDLQISAVDAKIQPEEAPFELNTQSTECARICYEAKLFQEKKRRQENCGVPVASAASTLHSLLVMNIKTAESKRVKLGVQTEAAHPNSSTHRLSLGGTQAEMQGSYLKKDSGAEKVKRVTSLIENEQANQGRRTPRKILPKPAEVPVKTTLVPGLKTQQSTAPVRFVVPKVAGKLVTTAEMTLASKMASHSNVEKSRLARPELTKSAPVLKAKENSLKRDLQSETVASEHSPDKKAQTKSIVAAGFLGCSDCGKTFTLENDHFYRNHMTIKHGKEVTDQEVLRAKLKITEWNECRSCSTMILNNLEYHRQTCCPEVKASAAFQPVDVRSTNTAKFPCGLCKDFAPDFRPNLAFHLRAQHPEISKRIILCPTLRCAQCLQGFGNSADLTCHASSCPISTKPSPETVQELAQRNLICEICCTRHCKIRETLLCFQNKILLRCILCLQMFKNRSSFFDHLRTVHDGPVTGFKCPFCENSAHVSTREAFDHILDVHYSQSLKKAGEEAIARTTASLQAQSAARRYPRRGLASDAALGS